MVAPFCDGETFEEEKAFAVDDVVAKVVEELLKTGQRELGLWYMC